MTDTVREALIAAMLSTDAPYARTSSAGKARRARYADAVLAALAQPAQPEGWRAMDSAPKDGTRVIVSDGLGVYGGAWWHERLEVWLDCDRCSPTHWRPLPPAHLAAREGDEG